MITVLAPAKINLGLEIIGKRADGFHEIRTIFCTVSLFDRVQIKSASNSSLHCDGPEVIGANLAESAIQIARKLHPRLPPVRVTIRKRVPVAAGLGGASSDAAATLLGLNRLAREPLDCRELNRAAMQCGSDVPFLLNGGLAMGRGRGDQLEPLPYRPLFMSLIVPTIAIPDKTRAMYARITQSDWTDGSRIEASAARMRTGHGLQDADLGNAFATPLFDQFPAARAIAAQVESVLARQVHISGAGPAMYTLAPDYASALRDGGLIRQAVPSARARVYCVRSTSQIMIQPTPYD
jgi:4-diphosphocytidyl-2-C-methyl-D-erythritol kinase